MAVFIVFHEYSEIVMRILILLGLPDSLQSVSGSSEILEAIRVFLPDALIPAVAGMHFLPNDCACGRQPFPL